MPGRLVSCALAWTATSFLPWSQAVAGTLLPCHNVTDMCQGTAQPPETLMVTQVFAAIACIAVATNVGYAGLRVLKFSLSSSCHHHSYTHIGRPWRRRVPETYSKCGFASDISCHADIAVHAVQLPAFICCRWNNAGRKHHTSSALHVATSCCAPVSHEYAEST